MNRHFGRRVETVAINYEIHPSTTPMADTSCSSGFGWPSIRDDRRDDESLEAGGSYRCLAPVSLFYSCNRKIRILEIVREKGIPSLLLNSSHFPLISNVPFKGELINYDLRYYALDV